MFQTPNRFLQNFQLFRLSKKAYKPTTIQAISISYTPKKATSLLSTIKLKSRPTHNLSRGRGKCKTPT